MEKVRLYHINESKEGIELLEMLVNKHLGLRILNSSQSTEEALEEIQRFFPDIVIIDENVVNDLKSYIQTLLLKSPYIGIIVTTSNYSTNKARELMNVGVRDVLAKPFNSEDFVKSVTSVHRYIEELKLHLAKNSSRILTRAPKMITVFSTKGGVGKSVISTLLASGLSSHLKEETVIVDLDLQFGDVSLLLDLRPKNTITNAVEKVEGLTSQEMKKLLTKHSMGMHVLSAPLNPEEEEFITEESLIKIFKLLKSEFDYVVVDSPPGFTSQAITALEQSDLVLFVTSPEISALKNTKNGLKTLNQLDIDKNKVKILINRYSNKTKFDEKTVEDILEMPIYTKIPDDYEQVIQFLNLGDPSVIYDSNKKIGKVLKQMLNNLRSYHLVNQHDKKWNIMNWIVSKFKRR